LNYRKLGSAYSFGWLSGTPNNTSSGTTSAWKS
jgi:hypothetical protein